jgi:hypothetical protein
MFNTLRGTPSPSEQAHRIDASAVNACIPQIDERGRYGSEWAGRQSCVLTNQLNTLVLEDLLNVYEAWAVQHAALHNPRYAEGWVDDNKFKFTRWVPEAQTTRNLIQAELGVRMPLAEATERKLLPKILDAGGAIAISGSYHCVTGFRPEGVAPNRVTVVDPLKRPVGPEAWSLRSARAYHAPGEGRAASWERPLYFVD